ncbi:sigma-70 family RNA polymerase sigma factor [uncultured Vagococcus sp.]|uniref:sigma-70 family RNA polymerase sigma factor n=1 Tax=uncultured Vagococcus sp. TaxID=189676 RepID=UPI0028D21D5C|nr:sigma-70 family RNA polymerase sigma factor [uncultured Vagococcus sp.]
MNEDDMAMLALVKAGDYLGLEYLIELYGTDILRTIHYILNHPAENSFIEDVQNKVFYRLWQELKQYNPEKSSLKTWITVIARNQALDEKRRIIRQLKITPTDSPDTDEQIEEHYFERENFLALLVALSTEDQVIFLKHYFYQDKIADIANDLYLSPEIVYNRLSRGRKKLRQHLQKKKGQEYNE